MTTVDYVSAVLAAREVVKQADGMWSETEGGSTEEANAESLQKEAQRVLDHVETLYEKNRSTMTCAWIMRDMEGGVDEVLAPCTYAEAEAAAESWMREADWGEVTSTTWVSVGLRSPLDSRSDTWSVEIEPEEPECEKGSEHNWKSPYSIVGGIEENPGVWGHGGGVIIKEVCMECGCARITDTWAQNPENGEQGLTGVEYDTEEFLSDIATFRKEEDAE